MLYPRIGELIKKESGPIYDYGMRSIAIGVAVVALAGCAQLDPHNMIGRQVWDPTATTVEVVQGPRAPLSVEQRQQAFDFVWETIRDHYYDPKLHGADWNAVRARYQPLALKALDDEAFWDVLDRMAGELRDAHTRVESPSRVALRKLDQVISLGVSFVQIAGRLAVATVHPDSDAWWAGVRPGMTLATIEGEDAQAAYRRLMAETRLDSTERSRHLRAMRRITAGTEGSKIRLGFERADGTRFEMDLARRKVSTRPTASHRVLPSGFGYLRLTQWTLGVMPRAMEGLDALRNTPGLVIDLRGNPGGSLHAVNAMLERFFEKPTHLGRVLTRSGKPVSLFFGAVEVIKLTSEVGGSASAYKGPVVILVNATSGSGSEFFAATMQAAGRAVVAGEPSCGCLLGFLGYARVPGGAELAYSEVGFVMSNGKRIEGEGVVPDHLIPLTVEDLRLGRDRTLEQSQEILRAMAAAAGKP
jgi:carboxyl-terminal processing protease